MHPYLTHLLADIATAHRTDEPEPQYAQSFEEEMEEVERWCMGEDAPHTFGYWCGLEKEQFPPVDQLKDDEMDIVNKAFEHMMFSWNLGIDLPDTMPASVKYVFIVDTLNKKTSIPNHGMIHFDFCTGYAPGCELGQYCPCLEIWNKPFNYEMPEFSDDDEQPF